MKFLCKGAYEVQHINSTPLGSVHKEKKKTINKSLFLSLKLSHTLKRKWKTYIADSCKGYEILKWRAELLFNLVSSTCLLQ